MKVEQLGYEGNCFPKDMEAFANFLESDMLNNVIKVNNKLIGER